MDHRNDRTIGKEEATPLVKLTRSRQVTIPKQLYDELNLQQGEYVEIAREGDHLILRPKQIIDREREEAKERFFRTVEHIWERNKDVDPDVVQEEVGKALEEVRQARRDNAATNTDS